MGTRYLILKTELSIVSPYIHEFKCKIRMHPNVLSCIHSCLFSWS